MFIERDFNAMQMEIFAPKLPSEEEVYNEAYYGRQPELLEAVKLFDSLMRRAKKVPRQKFNPNKAPETTKIEKCFQKLFGLKGFYFYWIPNPGANAFTINFYGIVLAGSHKKFIERTDKSGFYDKDHKFIITVYGYPDTLYSGMTGEELTAIFLHEIGHNFDFSKYQITSYISEVLMGILPGITIEDTVEANNILKEDFHTALKTEGDKLYKDEENRKKQIDRFDKMIERMMNRGFFRSFARSLFLFLANSAYATAFLPLKWYMNITDIGGKKGEQFADSFATAYGFGPQLISGLNKLGLYSASNYTKKKKSTPVRIIRNFEEAQEEIALGMLECHGTHSERCKDCLRKLRTDLKSGDYNPKMKETLENEIAELEKRYQAMLNMTDGEKNYALVLVRRIVDKIFFGSLNITKIFKPNFY